MSNSLQHHIEVFSPSIFVQCIQELGKLLKLLLAQIYIRQAISILLLYRNFLRHQNSLLFCMPFLIISPQYSYSKLELSQLTITEHELELLS